MTLSRSWVDDHNQWHSNSSYHVHDVPCLLYLLDRAHGWALSMRTQINGDK